MISTLKSLRQNHHHYPSTNTWLLLRHLSLSLTPNQINHHCHRHDEEEEDEPAQASPPPPPPPPPSEEEEKACSTIFNLMTSSSPSNPSSFLSSPTLLSLTPLLLSSPTLLPRLLRRVRFSHSNPLPPLRLFTHLLTRHPSSFTPPPLSLDTLLYVLGRSRLFPHAHHLLDTVSRLHPSSVTPRSLHVLLSRVAKCCSVRRTVHAFFQLQRLVRPFATPCFNALLRTLSQEKSMADARHVYHALKHRFRPDRQTFNILLSGWKSAEDAESFFAEMLELGVDPDVVTYNCLVDVYCKGREMEKAYKVIERMRGEEIYPDVITYTSVIGGLGLIGQPDKAKEVLKEMREAGCYPDVAAYNAAIRNYCIAKRLGSAFALLDEISARGLAPNPTTYNLFFRCFYWTNDLESSWRLYGRMKKEGCLPNTQSCMFLVRMCRRHEKVGMAMELWEDMVEKGFGSFTLVSDVLFDLLCDMGKLDEAERCFGEMVEKGQKPSQVSFRRIKVLMELAKRHESIRDLEKKMESFRNMSRFDAEREGMPSREKFRSTQERKRRMRTHT